MRCDEQCDTCVCAKTWLWEPCRTAFHSAGYGTRPEPSEREPSDLEPSEPEQQELVGEAEEPAREPGAREKGCTRGFHCSV